MREHPDDSVKITIHLLLKYREQMTTAAIKNGNPPTKVMLINVVNADNAYITLRPKLSGKVLSTPSKSLPNLLSRRPRETVSWKRMLAKRTASSKPAKT